MDINQANNTMRSRSLLYLMGIDTKFHVLIQHGFHIKFEKADEENDTEFFNWFYNHPHPEMKICGEFMDLWVTKTTGVFDFKHYLNWKKRNGI